MTNRRLGVVCVAASLAASSLAPVSAQQAIETGPPVLFAPVGPERPGSDRTVIREQPVGVDVELMRDAAVGVGSELVFDFFDGAAFVVQFDRQHARPEAWWDLGSTWTGVVPGHEGGWFVLTLQEDVLTVNLWTGDGRAFQLRLDAEGEHAAQELDLDAFDPCAGGLDPRENGQLVRRGGVGRATECSDDVIQIDVMVVYTPEARQAAGGTPAIQGIAINSVVATNAAYVNSEIEFELRLVHTAEVAYVETNDMITDIYRLTDPSDGYMDEVHGWRDQHAADLVALLTRYDPNYCGVAWLMYENSPEVEPWGFSVTRYDCAVGAMVFAHEVGHNQGACHAPGDGGGCNNGGIFPYSLGHRYTGNSGQTRRTIMAYSPGVRIDYFSNPAVNFDGRPTGTSGRNNARTLNDTAEAVSLYRPTPGAWMREATTGPLARSSHAMAYDVARGRTLLFGGYTGTHRDETWEWDGAAWTLRQTEEAPTARSSHAMVYDSARNRVVLFGGAGAGGYRGDTWEWTGTQWIHRSNAGPSARSWHAMAYDSARQRVVLFGGGGATGFRGDTWEWNGTSWQLRSDTGPAPRHGHAMAFDPVRKRVVLFGGWNGVRLNDLWEWDGEEWVEIIVDADPDSMPTPRYGHAMAFDTWRQSIILFGGQDPASRRGDTWAWDGAEWTIRANFGASPRWLHAMSYDTWRQQLVLFGGNDGVRRGDTWELASTCGAICYADCNRDGEINTIDFICFLNLFVAGDLRADCNGDTVVNSIDFVCFLNAFSAGCE